MTDTQNLIARLSQTPHRSFAAYRRQRVLAFSLALTLSFVLQEGLLGIRSDLSVQMTHADYMIKLVMLVLINIFALRNLAAAAVPDGAAPVSRRMTIGLLLAVVALSAVPLVQGDIPRVGPDALQCIFWINVFGMVPLGVLAWFLRQAAPTRPVEASLSLAIAAWANSALAYTIHCDSDLAFAPASGNITMLVLYALALPLMAGISYLMRNRLIVW